MKAIFLDRDGTIIEDANYTKNPDDVKLIPNAVAGMRLMRQKGYLLFVVSNQSGVGRGIMTCDEFWGVHKRFSDLLEAEKVDIAEFGYCFHHPEDNCNCRKPNPGLVPHKFQGEKIEHPECFVVGDRHFDMFLADKIGAKCFLVLSGAGKETQEKLTNEGSLSRYQVCGNLLEVAQLLPNA